MVLEVPPRGRHRPRVVSGAESGGPLELQCPGETGQRLGGGETGSRLGGDALGCALPTCVPTGVCPSYVCSYWGVPFLRRMGGRLRNRGLPLCLQGLARRICQAFKGTRWFVGRGRVGRAPPPPTLRDATRSPIPVRPGWAGSGPPHCGTRRYPQSRSIGNPPEWGGYEIRIPEHRHIAGGPPGFG